MVLLDDRILLDIVTKFSKTYYSLFNKCPQNVSRFYGEHATLTHSSSVFQDQYTLHGLPAIQRYFGEKGIEDKITNIYSLRTQVTPCNSLLLCVVGVLERNSKPYWFTQTFTLSPLLSPPRTYIINNDIMQLCEPLSGRELPKNTSEEPCIVTSNDEIMENGSLDIPDMYSERNSSLNTITFDTTSIDQPGPVHPQNGTENSSYMRPRTPDNSLEDISADLNENSSLESVPVQSVFSPVPSKSVSASASHTSFDQLASYKSSSEEMAKNIHMSEPVLIVHPTRVKSSVKVKSPPINVSSTNISSEFSKIASHSPISKPVSCAVSADVVSHRSNNFNHHPIIVIEAKSIPKPSSFNQNIKVQTQTVQTKVIQPIGSTEIPSKSINSVVNPVQKQKSESQAIHERQSPSLVPSDSSIDKSSGTTNSSSNSKSAENSEFLKSIFVIDLPENVTEKELSNAFSSCGRVESAVVNNIKHFGFVSFSNTKAVERAIKEKFRVKSQIVRVFRRKPPVTKTFTESSKIEKETIPFEDPAKYGYDSNYKNRLKTSTRSKK